MKIKTLIVLMLAVIATTTRCTAKTPVAKTISKPVKVTDTIMQKAIGDSLYCMINQAKKIELSLLPQVTDSIKKEVKKKIASKEIGTVHFIVSNPKNYLSNVQVYGKFVPQLKITYTHKKQIVHIKYDFGLRKWGLFDAEDKVLGMFDLASDNMLRFACQKFPENRFFHELLMTREVKTK